MNTPVNIGDTLSINDFKIVLTDAIIKANPKKFIEISVPEYVKCVGFTAKETLFTIGKLYKVHFNTYEPYRAYLNDDKNQQSYVDSFNYQHTKFEEVTKSAYDFYVSLSDARRLFPVGSRVKSPHRDEIFIVSTVTMSNNGICKDNWLDGVYYQIGQDILATGSGETRGYYLRKGGVWATIISEYVLTTFDGIRKNVADSVYVISTRDYSFDQFEVEEGFLKEWNSSDWKFFHSLDDLKKWIDKTKTIFITEDKQPIKFGEIYYLCTLNFDICEKVLTERDISFACGTTTFKTREAAITWKMKNQPLFKTEDGVTVVYGSKVFLVRKSALDIPPYELIVYHYRPTVDILCFSTKEIAEKWVRENKPKDLDYFINLLYSPNVSFYMALREKEPKLFWSKVLHLIADYFNQGNRLDKSTKYFISRNSKEETVILKHESVNYGLPYFLSAGAALKASEIMGDKLLLTI